MKEWKVRVIFTHSVWVTVEAEDEAEARENAESVVEDMSYDEMDCEIDTEIGEVCEIETTD